MNIIACSIYYEYIKESSNNNYITINEVDDIFNNLLSQEFELLYIGEQESIDGVRFYKSIFDRLTLVKKYGDIIDLVEYYYFENIDNPFIKSKYNIVQYMAKLVTCILWQKINKFVPKHMPQKELKKIVSELEIKRNQFLNK
jgi:hypothetical protein